MCTNMPFIVVLTRTTNFQYDVARRISEPHMSAKFHGRYCSVCELRCLNSKKEKKMKNFGK